MSKWTCIFAESDQTGQPPLLPTTEPIEGAEAKNAPGNESQRGPSGHTAQEKVTSSSGANRDAKATADQQSGTAAKEPREPSATAPPVAPAVGETSAAPPGKEQEGIPSRVPVSPPAVVIQSDPEATAVRADPSKQTLPGVTAAEAANRQLAETAALPDKVEEPEATQDPTATFKALVDGGSIRTEPVPGAGQSGVENNVAVQEARASADATAMKDVEMQPSEPVSIAPEGQAADSALPAQSSLQGEAPLHSSSTVKPPPSEPVAQSVERLEEALAAHRPPDKQREAQSLCGSDPGKPDSSLPSLGGVSAAVLPAAPQSMQPEVGPSNPAVAASNIPPSDPSARTDEMNNIQAASLWQQHSEAQMLAASTGASLMHMALPIYQHGWLPLLATHLGPNSNQLGGFTPQPVTPAPSSSAPYRQTLP